MLTQFLVSFSAAEVQAPDETKIPRVAIVAIGKNPNNFSLFYKNKKCPESGTE